MAKASKITNQKIEKELRITHTEIINLMRLQGLDIGDFQDLDLFSTSDGSFDQYRAKINPGDEVVFRFTRFSPPKEVVVGEGEVCPPVP